MSDGGAGGCGLAELMEWDRVAEPAARVEGGTRADGGHMIPRE